ncbi:ornithine carbamoyltransferase [Candidatus Bathyarchaeota archaeon]|nr:MAG: ornithine carbamoyltransferase [Candidatus Bathyarchaeota archaeon]TMI44902.1 MAG: ornithine carbamoyltransferase [Candidatus Bathyarchaeota archaeon]
MVGLKGRDILSLVELSAREIDLILKHSAVLARRTRIPQQLKGKTVALIFQKPSTRTRVSFETAVAQQGGHPIYLSWNEMQLGRGETISDTAKVLDRYVNAITARVYSHDDLVVLAENAEVPVINGLSDKHHPCQILADLLTLIQYKKRLKGLKIAYVGDGNNVCNSLLIGCAKTGVDIAVARPRGYGPDPEAIKHAEEAARTSGATVSIVEDPEEAVKGTDAIYTDTFVSMGMEKEKDTRLSTFIPKYQVTRTLLSHAKPGAIFLHCLPAHRGEEVTEDVIDGSQSAVWDEAENRLHTARGLLSLIL